MANEKRLIDAHELAKNWFYTNDTGTKVVELLEIEQAPTVDAVEVVHGRWERCGGDLHSSGYAIFCSVCNKVHFVHRKYSLGGLNCKELFEKPKYCPNCGAKMDGESNG